MRTTGFTSVVEARRELINHGYTLGFSSPGRPALWAKSGARERDHKAIAIANNETEYKIVPYPGPATARTTELEALRARDKIIGYREDVMVIGEPGSAMPALPETEVDDLSFLQ